MTVLKTIDELRAPWLAEALGAPVVGFSTRPVGTGQMGESFRVELTYDGAPTAPASVVVKLASTDPSSRATGLALRAYEVEVSFYRTVASTLQVRVPACHLAEVDVDTGWFTLLLEDMAPATQGDHFAGVDADAAALAMVELAGLHGPRWDDPALAAQGWLNRQTPQALTFTTGLVRSLWPGFLDRYGDQLAPEHVAVCERLVDRLGPYLLDRRGPLSVVHGDYRLDNLLFGPPGGTAPLTVVDWQTAVWGPPLVDAAYFLSFAFADRGVRAATERDLLRVYHDALRGFGVESFDFDRCWSDYRRSSFAALVMAIASSMLVERTERGDRMFLTTVERACAQVEDLDALALLP
ncbi:MAG: phosphotransferase [Mycobacteriales bacterium]